MWNDMCHVRMHNFAHNAPFLISKSYYYVMSTSNLKEVRKQWILYYVKWSLKLNKWILAYVLVIQ